MLLKTVDAVKRKGYRVGGMISREVRENGMRVGFKILDLNSSKNGWLASVNQKGGPHVWKYRVNMEDLDFIGAKAIEDAVEKCAIIAIDEIGPLELFQKSSRKPRRKRWKAASPL